MIHIDFQGGAHGNYLEFVCNKIAGLTVGSPFDSLGTSHAKTYTRKKLFYAHHYSFLPKPFVFDKIISIRVDIEDILPLLQISLLRAGPFPYDNDQLEHNTYNKLNNRVHKKTLDAIIEGFFKNQIQNSYNAVKDPSWPDVTTLTDFKNLPDWIKQECVEQHKLELLELSPDRPDCPRSILREFFQNIFLWPEKNVFLTRQQQVNYDSTKQVYYFPYTCFYNKSNFLQELEKVVDWTGIAYTCQQDIANLHDEFLQKQPYKNSKFKCDSAVAKIQSGNTNVPSMTLLEEAYINVKLGQNYFA